MKKESPFSKISKKDISSHTEKETKEEKNLNETTVQKEEQTRPTENNLETSATLQMTEKEDNYKNLHEIKKQTPESPEIQEAGNESPAQIENEDNKNSKEQKKEEYEKKASKIIDDNVVENKEESTRSSIEEKFAKIKKVRGVQISCYMDADISHEIDRIAEKTGTPKSQIINTLLRESLFGN